MRELLSELDRALEQGRPCVYCAVVETRGSTPQKAGAAMLVFADGAQAGTLGGGCVEAEVKRQALRTLSGADPGQAALLTFCLDDNFGWDDGLICGGRMSILADPQTAHVDKANPGALYYKHLRKIVESGLGCTEAVVMKADLGCPIGARFLFDALGKWVCQSLSTAIPNDLPESLIPLATRPRAYCVKGIAFLPTLPRITLFIVGAGHVGKAVAALAAEVDFDVWVLDDREPYVSSDRFPTASRRIVGDIGQSLKKMADSITPSTYALVITRGHGHDEEALYHLAASNAGYVGMIGSKRKIKLIFEDLRARGISSEALDRVHAPLGIPIGSQTVPEIAISIVAELIASRNLARSGQIAQLDLEPV